MLLVSRKINITNLAILILFQLILSFSCKSENGDLIKNQTMFTVRLAPDNAKTSVAYGSFLPHQSALSKIECEGYDQVEWHQTVIDEKGIMRMRKKNLPISLVKNKEIHFVPNGDHLMLIGKNRKLKEGDLLQILFIYSNETKTQITAKVVK